MEIFNKFFIHKLDRPFQRYNAICDVTSLCFMWISVNLLNCLCFYNAKTSEPIFMKLNILIKYIMVYIMGYKIFWSLGSNVHKF